jgi:hypothetical protein
MTDLHPHTDTPKHSGDDQFEIGGEDLLEPHRKAVADRGDELGEAQTDGVWEAAVADIRIRIGTLLKAETVSFLLGAGASVDCGGLLIGSVPLAVERTLHEEGIAGDARPRIRRWLTVFYLAAYRASGGETGTVGRDAILERREKIAEADTEAVRLPVNFERVLALLHRWRAALPESGGRLRVDGSPGVDVTSQDLDDVLAHATRALARHCVLPTDEKLAGCATYKTLLRKVLMRPLNLKRVNVFTLNYDTLVEQAADAEGVVLLDSFVGTVQRIFRPESYEQDLYFPAETTEGRVHRFDRVLHLYKLHGSISWVADSSTIDNPYGVTSTTFDPDKARPLLIYPTPAKFGETLGMPYSELFRRFAGTVARPQSVLFVVGYGFGDEHVNAIIRQALAVPSFTLVVVDPNPTSQLVRTLRELKDRRVWIVRGTRLGAFSAFVENVLPDLRDEEIRKKVLATHRALDHTAGAMGGVPHGD